MVEKKWSVGIWRTDLWMPVCEPELVGLEGVVGKRSAWALSNGEKESGIMTVASPLYTGKFRGWFLSALSKRAVELKA